MFYSQVLILRKGVLKTIWIAAYCQKRLKKDQVALADISSSVDEIILNEPTVTYRVLGYLLFGVVTIYSKKVDYLYNDFSELLCKLKTYAPAAVKRHKGDMSAPFSSITLPDRFDLDCFDLQLPEFTSDRNVVPSKQITLEERWEPVESQHFSLDDENFEEEEFAHFENSNFVHNTPVVQDALSPQSMDTYMEACPSHAQTNLQDDLEKLLCNHLPVEESFGDVLSYGAQESDEIGTQCNEVDSQAKQMICLEIPSPDHEKSCAANGDHLAYTQDGTPQTFRLPHVGVSTPEVFLICTPAKEHPRSSRKRKHIFDETVVLSNKVMKQGLLDSSGLIMKRRVVPLSALDAWKRTKFKDLYQDFSEPIICCSPQLNTVYSRRNITTELRCLRKRKHLIDDTTCLSNEVMRQNLEDSSDLIIKRKKTAVSSLDVWKEHRLLCLPQDFSEPLIPCTPLFSMFIQKTAGARTQLSFETKHLFDETTELSDKEMRQNLDDSSGLVTKRSKAPVSPLDAWKLYQLPKLYQDLLQSLVLCTPWQKTVFYRRSIETPQPENEPSQELPETSERSFMSEYQTHEERLQGSPETAECSVRSEEDRCEADMEEPSLARADSEVNTINDSTYASVETPTTTKSYMEEPVTSVSQGDDDVSETVAQDIGINLVDEEAHSCEKSVNTENLTPQQFGEGWTSRTRQMADFLVKSFTERIKCGNSDGLNLKQFVKGRTRRESARLFYEVLVLSSKGFVDVKQSGEYGDITLLSTPQLMTIA
ncbi:hypothetical protein ACHQM5_010653 [Ranunculus cassubicifolius]